MTYLFKLTRRLAHSRSLTLLVAGIAACSTGDRSITAPGGGSDLQRNVSSSSTVAKVTVSPSSATGSLGQSAQFSATATNSVGAALSATTTTWTSTDSTIVAITPSGYATAVGVGSATLIATINGVRGQAAVTVTGDPIASITISPTSASGSVGQTAVFGTTLYDAAGAVLTGRRVLFTTSNAAVVTVDSTGLAKGIGNGSATITATSGGKSAAAAITVGGATQTITNPGAVSDLAIASIADTTASLSFTQVNDGTGQPAKYEIRYAIAPISWGSATAVAKGTCTAPIAGTTIGAKLTCSINGLVASTAYNFQIVAFRGTPNVNAVFGALSNPLAATTTAPATAQPTVASVTVTPGSAGGSVGQSAQFSATVKDANGNVMTGQNVTWSSTNNAVVSVTSAGYATATGGGSAAIVAAAGGKSGQAAITVTGSTSGGTVSSVVVSPSSATIVVGATQQLTSTLKDLLGNILTGLTTTWTSSNPAVASVNGSGMVTGVSAGSAAITATSGGVSSSASISISSSSTAPPPSSAGWTNAPSSYPVISDQPFDQLASLNWLTAWNNNGLMGISTDASAPASASSVLQFTYPVGFAGGSAPAMSYRDFGAATHFYSGIWWKANANWQGHNSNVNKLQFVYLNGTGGDVAFEMYGPPGGPYDLRSALELNNADTRFFLVPNVNNVKVTVGSWHKIEWQIEYNTTTNPANGIVRWWMDGVLIGQYTDVLFPTVGIVEYQLSPTWGGVGDVKTQTDYFWYDHVFLKGY